MRPRTEALVGFAIVAVLATLAALAGRSNSPAPQTTRSIELSTFRTTPGGAKGLFDAARRMGIDVRRFRERPKELARFAGRPHQLLAILDPVDISSPDAMRLAQFIQTGDLLLAGEGAERVMRCFGYKLERHPFDSVRVEGTRHGPWIHAVLRTTGQAVYTDSTRASDVARLTCRVPTFRWVTPLLRSSLGTAIIQLEGDSGRRVILVSDPALLANQTLRDTDAGPLMLGLIVGRYEHVVFDEYHHGYGASGSLAAAALEWSGRSPWGWAVWQLAGVGILALLAGGVRFGPTIPAISRRRRSPLEHVRALATALAAAHGHDEAIGAIVRGLRRRTAPHAMRSRGDWRAWVAERSRREAPLAERTALATLASLTQPGQPPASVLLAAHAVEDLWKHLQH